MISVFIGNAVAVLTTVLVLWCVSKSTEGMCGWCQIGAYFTYNFFEIFLSWREASWGHGTELQVG